MTISDLQVQTHALYRFYGPEGELLYVGLTNDPGRRWQRHSEDKPWWHDVARIDIEQHPTRAAVRAVERAAIETERPRHNVRMNGRTRQDAGSRSRQCPPKPGHPFLVPGKVIALGLDDHECPVGIIDSSDDTWVTLALFSWITGCFGHQDRTYRVADVRQFLEAGYMTEGDKRRGGYPLTEDIYDMDPLGDFQIAWKERG